MGKRISESALQPTPGVRMILMRVMREILTHGAIEQAGQAFGAQGLILHKIDLEKLRIVIGKGMAIAYRMGQSAGRDEMQTRRHS